MLSIDYQQTIKISSVIFNLVLYRYEYTGNNRTYCYSKFNTRIQHFKVIIFNDDFTTMEFVVKILTTIFFKSAAEAETLMLQVHKSQSAVVGIYTYDIAQSKVQKATRMAREENFPLRLTVAPEEE